MTPRPIVRLDLEASPVSARVTRALPVLLAEDDDELRRVIAETLRADGYEVVEAADGLELLDEIEASIRQWRRDRFALIVTDVRMPELSGLDVLAALHCAAWRTPVILITAFPSDETRAEALELGAARVLAKPIDMEDLRAAVAAVLYTT